MMESRTKLTPRRFMRILTSSYRKMQRNPFLRSCVVKKVVSTLCHGKRFAQSGKKGPRCINTFLSCAKKNTKDHVFWAVCSYTLTGSCDEHDGIRRFNPSVGTSVFHRHMEMHSRNDKKINIITTVCLLYTSPSPRDQRGSRMPSSA